MSKPKYDEYQDIPVNFIPTTGDLWALLNIVINVKEAIKIRHDFQTASDIADKTEGVLRLPGSVRPWESNFANTARPDAKTLAGLAAEHKRLILDSQSYGTQVLGNFKLAMLIRQNLGSLFPDIGFNDSTGERLHKLLRKEKSVLQIFNPMGVEDNRNLIRLLIKQPRADEFYW